MKRWVGGRWLGVRLLLSMVVLVLTYGPVSVRAAGDGDGWVMPADRPAVVLLRRSRVPSPKGRGDVLVPADLATDAVAQRASEVFSERGGYLYFSLRLHQLVKNYLAHDPALSVEERAILAEPTYFFLSDRVGGFPGDGFWLEQPNGELRDLRHVPFVDVPVTLEKLSGDHFGDTDQIFPHELGHILLRELIGDTSQSMTAAVHYTTVRTDPWKAFDEGWGEHFEPEAMDRGLHPALTAARAAPLPTVYGGWYARFDREQRQGCLFCPANLLFLAWHEPGENQLRDGGVRENRFSLRVELPGELLSDDRPAYEAQLYRDVVPPEPGAMSNNGAQQLSSEGVVATFFYRLMGDARLQASYREPAFYEPFLLPDRKADWSQVRPEELFTPQENVYLKVFDVMARSVNWKVGEAPGPLVQFVRGYAERFPDEAGVIYEIFLEVTHGATMDPAAGLHGAEPGYLAGLKQTVLQDAQQLDAALGPQFWLLNEDVEGGLGVLRYFPLRAPLAVDLNAADVTDLRMISGVDAGLAQRLVAARDRHGHWHSLEEVAEVDGVSPEVLGRLQSMQAAVTELAAEEPAAGDEGDDSFFQSLMVPMLIGSYVVAAVFQLGRLWLAAGLLAAGVGAVARRWNGVGKVGSRTGWRRARRALGWGLKVVFPAMVLSLLIYAGLGTAMPLMLGVGGTLLGGGLLWLRHGRKFSREWLPDWLAWAVGCGVIAFFYN